MRAPWFVVIPLVACAPASPDDADGTGTSTDPGSTDTAAPTTGEPATDTGPPPLAQCPDGNVILSTQAQVQALAGCTDISGDLSITDAVTSLAPLSALHHVAGTLYIGYTAQDASVPPPLTDLHGLEALASVGGLSVSGLAELTSLEPLAGLTTIPGALAIYSLPQLTSLEGLHTITDVGGSMGVGDCHALVDLQGLRGLRRVGSHFGFQDVPITDLHGLDGLTDVGVPGGEPVSLYLSQNHQLTTLDGLDAVVWHDALIVDLDDNPALVDLGVLADASELLGLGISASDSLTDLAGLESLTVVHGGLHLDGNDALVDISALAGLQSVDYLSIRGSQPLTDLGPLTALTSIGTVELTWTDLVDLGPLPALQTVDRILIGGNQALASLSGLAGVTTLERLDLSDNDALVDLSGLAGLAAVTGEFDLRENDALTALTDLGALTSVGGRLDIVLNTALPQTDAVAWGAAIAAAGGRKIAANKDPDPPADPCPWQDDQECDEVKYGTGACVDGSDVDDCFVSD